MEQAVALIHRTKEAAAAEQAALFDQFLLHILYLPFPARGPPRFVPPHPTPLHRDCLCDPFVSSYTAYQVLRGVHGID